MKLNIKTHSSKSQFIKKYQEGSGIYNRYSFLNLKPKNFFTPQFTMNDLYNLDNTLKVITRFEGFEDKVYKDGNGIDTIGHGLTMKKYIDKGKITEEESLNGVREHIKKEVLPHLKNKPYWPNLSANRKDALISYVYNIGSGNFNQKSPNLQKALTNSNWKKAASEMDFGYNDTNNPGLKVRRDFERELFLREI